MLPWCETLDEWGAVFLDVSVFEGCVRDVARLAGLKCGHIEAGYPGSNAVFIVDDKYVVKIACPLFAEGLNVERAVLKRLDGPLYPRLIAQGEYWDGAHTWPWFIMEFMSGAALRDVYGKLTHRQLMGVVSHLARAMRALQPLTDIEHMPAFEARAARNMELNTARLLKAGVAQRVIDAWAQRGAKGLGGQCVLTHGDLTEDHLLIENGALSGIIDFADAAVAPPAYELAALYFGALGMEMELLHLFMDVYGLPMHCGFYEEQAAILMRHDCGAGILLYAFEQRGVEPCAVRGMEDIRDLYT